MRARLAAEGLVLLVIGFALVGVAVTGLLARTTIITTFNQPQAGEYVSSEIALNVTSVVAVTSPSTVGGLINASDLNAVSSSNISGFTIQYNSSRAGTDTYNALKGDYYYVAFSSVQPNTKIVASARSSATAHYGLLALVGFVLLVAGIIVAIVGAVKKGSQKPATVSEEEYYAKRKT